MFHDFLVVYAIPDVDIGGEGNGADGGVEVYYVGFGSVAGGCAGGMEVGVDSLHECGFAGACV